MAITDAEKVLFYELIDVPNDTSVLNIDGQFAAGRKQVDYAITTAKTEIDAKLDALAGEPLLRLQAILAQWSKVSFKEVRIRPTGSNEGVDSNPARARRLLRRRALTIVPVLVASRDQAGGIGLG